MNLRKRICHDSGVVVDSLAATLRLVERLTTASRLVSVTPPSHDSQTTAQSARICSRQMEGL